MNLKGALLSLTAAAMIAAPVAAQAGTKAADSIVKLDNLSGNGERKSAHVAKRQKAFNNTLLIVAGTAVAGVAAWGVYEYLDDDDDPAPNGSNGV